MTAPSRRLAELRASDLGAKLSAESILVLPLGAVEQHGPHLPFNTDLVIAERCAEAVMAAAGEALDLWLLEPLAYTKSNEHAGTPGTIWLGPETMLRVLDDIGRSVAATPVRKLALLNGHGGNSSLLNVACRELRLHHRLETFLLHPSLPPDQGGTAPGQGGTAPGQGGTAPSQGGTAPSQSGTAPSQSGTAPSQSGTAPSQSGTAPSQSGTAPSERGTGRSELGMGIHAGMAETSIMLHLRPELVRLDLAARNVPEHLAANHHVRFGGAVTFGWLASDFGDSGVIGDPTGADAVIGARLFAEAVDQLVAAFGEIKNFRFG